MDNRPEGRFTDGSPMARTGIRRGLVFGLLVFVVVIGLIAFNTWHEVTQTASTPGSKSQPVAPKQ